MTDTQRPADRERLEHSLRAFLAASDRAPVPPEPRAEQTIVKRVRTKRRTAAA